MLASIPHQTVECGRKNCYHNIRFFPGVLLLQEMNQTGYLRFLWKTDQIKVFVKDLYIIVLIPAEDILKQYVHPLLSHVSFLQAVEDKDPLHLSGISRRRCCSGMEKDGRKK